MKNPTTQIPNASARIALVGSGAILVSMIPGELYRRKSWPATSEGRMTHPSERSHCLATTRCDFRIVDRTFIGPSNRSGQAANHPRLVQHLGLESMPLGKDPGSDRSEVEIAWMLSRQPASRADYSKGRYDPCRDRIRNDALAPGYLPPRRDQPRATGFDPYRDLSL